MNETRTWTRCILLMPPGFEDEARLKQLTAAQDWIAVLQRDPWLVMAELCIRQRAMASRASWGLPAGERLVLVVAEPKQWHQHDELIEALGKYVPTIALWNYQQGRLEAMSTDPSESTPMNSRITATDPDAEKNKHDPETLEGASSWPFTPTKPLHLAPTIPDAPEIVVLKDANPPRTDDEEESTSITPKEIEMLLADPPQGDENS